MNNAEENKATLPVDSDPENARNWAIEKETISTRKLIAFGKPDPQFTIVVDARFYRGRSSRASVVHCSIWIRTTDGRYLSGRGQAGGHGYHKESAAFCSAVASAGIKLAEYVHGAGNHAVDRAIEAIGTAAGYGDYPTFVVAS